LFQAQTKASKKIENHAMRDLLRHDGGGRIFVQAPILPRLPKDHILRARERRWKKPLKKQREYENSIAKGKKPEEDRMRISRATF
jgi:hypothetical protein